MEQLTSLIYNFNTNCYKQYTEVSPYLGNKLNEVLTEIERFYYSNFWEQRFIQRLKEEGIPYWPIELDRLLGITTCLREDTIFKLYNSESTSNGVSDKGTMIGLNVNLDSNELSDSHISNVIMHEFGHRQYNQKAFRLVIELNKRVMSSPGLFIKNNEALNKEDYKYFTNHNELRQRIMPIVKEMYDNGWTLGETYDNSKNLEIDDIKNIFTREYILKLIDNIL